MRKKACLAALAALATAGLVASAGTATAANSGDTYTLQCGTASYQVVKPNENAATYTNGTMVFVTAIGAFMSDGTAQPNAVLCTINGFGPVPFIITPAH
jgi:hypothetical protein